MIANNQKLLDKGTSIMIVSDYGAKTMKELICANTSLENLGLLKFNNKSKPRTIIGWAYIH